MYDKLTEGTPKMEEIARELVFHFGVQGSLMNYETVRDFLLRSFIPASTTPRSVLIEAVASIDKFCKALTTNNDQVGTEAILEITGCAIKLKNFLATPASTGEPEDKNDN